jgi:hypothetical protein
MCVEINKTKSHKFCVFEVILTWFYTCDANFCCEFYAET